MSLTMDAIEFIQSGDVCYLVTIPFKKIAWFLEREPETGNLERAQRKLNERRIPKIKAYVENSSQYVLPPVVLTVKGIKEEYVEGRLSITIPDNTVVYVSDGQHRLHAIKDIEIVESIPVMIMNYNGIDRCKQVFTDLNMNLVKPTRSLSLYYDTTNELSKYLLDRVFSADDIEFEDITVKGESEKKYSMAQMYAAMKIIGGKSPMDVVVHFAYKNFYDIIIMNYKKERDKYTSVVEFREKSIYGHGIMLEILAIVYKKLADASTENVKARVSSVVKVLDFDKKADMWKDLILNGRIVKNKTHILDVGISIMARISV